MSAPEWVPVAHIDDLGGEGPHAVSAAGRELVVVRTPSGLRAYDGLCPHQGALLGEGELDGGTLVCRNHRWRFSAETGKREGGPQCLVACPIRERSGAVEVDVASLVSASANRTKGWRRPEDLPGPPALPFFGAVHLFELDRMHLLLEEWGRRYGTPYTYKFGPIRTVVFADLPAIQQVLRERPDSFRRGSMVEPVFRELGVHGVFSAEGEAWRPQRRLSMAALSQRNLRGFYPTLARVAERLRKRWLRAAEVGEALDLSEELKRFTVDVTTQLVFGRDLDTLGDSEDVIQRKLELIFPTFNRRLFSVIPIWRLIRSSEDRRVDRAVAELREWLVGLVQDARARLARHPELAEEPTNFLEAMLATTDENGEPFADDVIFGNAMTMLLAGEDTTAYTLAWAVHQLLDAQADVARLRAEADRAFGAAVVPPNFDIASGLAFAGAVANETMRLRPVAPLSFLEALTEVTVGDLVLSKGNHIGLLMRPVAKRPEHFGDPEAFRPMRWLDPVATGGAHEPGANLPFGSGPRICPGRSLAILEMKVVLATLYRTFDVDRLGPRRAVEERHSFTMQPSELRVRLRRRGQFGMVLRAP